MKTLFLILFSLFTFSCNGSDDFLESYYCETPGEIWCESTDKYYCSMDHEIIQVCDTAIDCETDCINVLVQILVDDIQGQL